MISKVGQYQSAINSTTKTVGKEQAASDGFEVVFSKKGQQLSANVGTNNNVNASTAKSRTNSSTMASNMGAVQNANGSSSAVRTSSVTDRFERSNAVSTTGAEARLVNNTTKNTVVSTSGTGRPVNELNKSNRVNNEGTIVPTSISQVVDNTTMPAQPVSVMQSKSVSSTLVSSLERSNSIESQVQIKGSQRAYLESENISRYDGSNTASSMPTKKGGFFDAKA